MVNAAGCWDPQDIPAGSILKWNLIRGRKDLCFELVGFHRQPFAVKATRNQTEEFLKECRMLRLCSIRLGVSCNYFFLTVVRWVEMNWTFPEEREESFLKKNR